MNSTPGAWWHDVTTSASNSSSMKAYTMYNLKNTSDYHDNGISLSLEASFTPNAGYETTSVANPLGQVKTVGILKQSRTAAWQANWRDSDTRTAVNTTCSDDGFSWPHRTLGWKMLKDDLFGIDIGGDSSGHPKLVGVGETRTYGGSAYTAHDVDSVCLDCHNPTIWNATSSSNHTDTTSSTTDDFNDDVLLRGLP